MTSSKRRLAIARALGPPIAGALAAATIVAAIDVVLSQPSVWFDNRIVFVSDSCAYSRRALAGVWFSDARVSVAAIGETHGEVGIVACSLQREQLFPLLRWVLPSRYLCRKHGDASAQLYVEFAAQGKAGALPKWVVGGRVVAEGVDPTALRAAGVANVPVPVKVVP